MKNRIIMLAIVVLAAFGMISCGSSNSASSGAIITQKNVDKYIKQIADYENRVVQVGHELIEEDTVSYYAELIFSNQAYEIEGWVAEEGDIVIIDYVGKMDGEAFAGGTAEGQSLILGSHTYISGFEEGLIGTKAGDVVDLELEFPDPYDNNPDYAGKPCVFTVTVTQVIPGLSDKSVAILNNDAFKTADDFKNYVRDMLVELDKEQFEQDVVQEVINQVVEESVFPDKFPTKLLNAVQQEVIDTYRDEASEYGIGVSAYLTTMGSSLEEQQISYIKENVIFYKIAKDQGIAVTDADVDARIQEFIEVYGDVNSAEDVYENIATREELEEAILVTKVFDYIISVTTVVDPE